MHIFRVIKSLKTPTTDTDDTDEDRALGGHCMYSHNTMALNHHHWVMQILSAGGFNVHCTQGPESSHKFNMHLAAERVKHGDSNETQRAMLKYLCVQLVFRQLYLMMVQAGGTRSSPTARVGLHRPLAFQFGKKLLSSSFRKTFLHSNIRLTVEELLLLICSKLGLPGTLSSFTQLSNVSIVIGSKFTRATDDGRGETFWATDSARSSIAGSRRDMLFLQGTEDGNALCAEAICFVQISNLSAIMINGTRPFLNEPCVNMVLVRWLTPHQDSWERDNLRRPICPGPLHLNNCLWKYAVTPNPRKSMVDTDGRPPRSWKTQRSLFGTTQSEQNKCRRREEHAYFGLVTPDSILDTMHMCNTFKPGSSNPEYGNWLQTVRLF